MEDDFTSLDSLPTRKQKSKKVTFDESALFSSPSNSEMQERTKYNLFKNLQSNPDLIKELTTLAIITFLVQHQTFGIVLSKILPGILRTFIVPENSDFISSAIKAVFVAISFYVIRLIIL